MPKVRNIFVTTLISILFHTNAYAGFFDNIVDSVKTGNLEGLVSEVAKEVAKGVKVNENAEQNNYSDISSFGDDNSEDELEESVYSEDSHELAEKNHVEREVSYGDVSINGCLFCSDKERNASHYKDEKTPFTGVTVEKYDDGEFKEKTYYKGGFITLSKSFYPTGGLQKEIVYKLNQEKSNSFSLGLRKYWHENGQLHKRVTYDKNGNAIGLFEEWYKNGQRFIKGVYKKGKVNGPYEEWHENGQLHKKGVLANGNAIGPYEKWHKNGQLRLKATYHENGNPVGSYKKWYENGQLKQLSKFRNDGSYRIIGLYQKWHANGQLKHQKEYNKDKELVGNIIESWDENGRLIKEKTYTKGATRPTKTHEMSFFKNGKKSKNIIITDLMSVNKHEQYFYNNGFIKSDKFYIDNKLIRLIQKDKDGSTIEFIDTGFKQFMLSGSRVKASKKSLEKTPSKPWDDDINYILDKNDSPFNFTLVDADDFTKARIGAPNKLNYPVVASQNKYLPPITVIDFEKALEKLIKARQKVKEKTKTRIGHINQDANAIDDLIFHFENYLETFLNVEISPERRRIHEIKERIRLVKLPSSHSGYTPKEIQAIENLARTSALTDSLFGTDILESPLMKVFLKTTKPPVTKKEKFDRLTLAIDDNQNILESILIDSVKVERPQYKPYQHEVLLADIQISTPSHISQKKNGTYYDSNNQSSFSGSWVATAKDLSIYTHDFQLHQLNKEKHFLFTDKKFKKDDYILNIDTVQFKVDKGELVKIVGWYPPVRGKFYPAFEASIKDGKYHGLYKEYYKPTLKTDGSNVIHSYVAKTALYKKGVKDGYYKQFSMPSTTTLKDRFVNSYEFDQQTIVADQNYKNGKLHGKFIYIYPTSMKASISGEYKNGNKHGEWNYYAYGNLVPEYSNIKETFKDGKIVQKFNVVNFDDLIVNNKSAKIIKSGKNLTGRATAYHDNGNIGKSTSYLKGKKHGLDFSFYENGYPRKMSTYKNGKLSGLYREWDDQGYIVHEASYKNNKLFGTEKTYYSFDEMTKLGHVYADVSWSTNDVNIPNEHYLKSYLRSGFEDADNKHIDYLVAIYKNGLLYNDVVYSKKVMSHPSVGFSIYLPMKSKAKISSGVANGNKTNFYPNGHKSEQGKMANGKKDGKWNRYHAWRPNQENTKNILMGVAVYDNGSLISEKAITTDEKLNTYGGRVYNTSYIKDMQYVTGLRQWGTCFNCAEVKTTPQFEQGFELRRNITNGTLEASISKVAQTQTNNVVASKRSSKLGDFLTSTLTIGKDNIAFNWNDSSQPKFDNNKITGGYESNKPEIKFTRYISPRERHLPNAAHVNQRVSGYDGYREEKLILRLNQDIVNHTYIKKSDMGPVIKDRGRIVKSNSLKITPVDGKLCNYTNIEETRNFNRKLIDLSKVPISMGSSVLGQEISKANKKNFDIYSSEYIDFLKSLGIRKSEKWDSHKRTSRKDVKFDDGLFSSSWVEKKSGKVYTGWVDEKYKDGNILKEFFVDDGTVIYIATYYENGQLKDEQYRRNKNINGPSLGYYKDGSLRYAGYELDGEDWLPYVYYHENGQIKSETLYWQGKEAGFFNEFFESGKISKQYKFAKSPDRGGELLSMVLCRESGFKFTEAVVENGEIVDQLMYDEKGVLELDSRGVEKKRFYIDAGLNSYLKVWRPVNEQDAIDNAKKTLAKKGLNKN